ncbi:DUF1493 family protein [Paraburkholderia sp. MMS20-SJTR3]|uniref:DUF1493 family protein n=1 Tax=Paraburkholderia sejongensis TaxID=2886946 RepID=A0ABS8JVP4_9BURK|nr:DUF1493 family protein [Paraburkholderia sp. MMS20-SJTR3]MCC8393977.1 DUF1493 family protein [Paraburkholderia sp. MMS20-SJTR3]
MNAISWAELEAFVRAEIGLGPSKRLSLSTRLWEDLDQTGDDASEFMSRFFARFAIDPGDFDFHRYFLMEGEGVLYSLFRRLILRRPHSLEREQITLRMLYQAVIEKQWNSERLAAGPGK